MARSPFTIPLLLVAALLVPAAAQARVPAGFVGMTSEELGGADTRNVTVTQTLAAQRRAGVRLLRQTFEWRYIERAPGASRTIPGGSVYQLPGYPLPGRTVQLPGRRFLLPRYDWSIQDRLVLAAARAGIIVLPVLFNPPAFQSSQPPGAGKFTYPPRDPASMAAFAAAAVGRFGPGGSLWRENPGVRARPIRAWQVWNEPSLRPYWGGKPNARAYVKLLKTVNDAIKARDRRAEVVTGGIPPSTLKGAVPIKKYVDQMYKAGGKKAFDTLAINSYARSAKELEKLLKSIRKIMNRRKDRGAKIWITELGWCDRGVRHRFCVGTRKQASLIRSSLKVIHKQRKRLRLRGFVYFSWRDGAPYAPDFRDQWGLHTGLLKVNSQPKPALKAFQRGARAFR
jgi:hypothetical protein